MAKLKFHSMFGKKRNLFKFSIIFLNLKGKGVVFLPKF